jgi:hypothetical protein
MNYQELIKTLTFLKENRKLGSEADELVAPFLGSVFFMEFRFQSLSRTFANPYDAAFEGGQTVVGDLIGSNLDFSLLLPPTENDWAQSLEMGEEFDGSAKFLGFDGLYQRGVFGYLGKLDVEDESLTDEPVVEDDEVADEDKVLNQSFAGESEAVREEEIQDDQSGEANPDPEEGIQEPDQEVSEEDVSQSEPDSQQVEAPGSEVKKPGEEKIETIKLPASAVDDSPDEKEVNRWEIERILDKEYEKGIESLTQEERGIYEKEQQGRQSKAQAKARRKKGPISHESVDKDTSPGGCRLFISFFLFICALLALRFQAIGPLCFFVLLSTYSLYPWITHWRGNDPCEGLFKTRFLKEQRFRRGIGLLLLAICMFGTFRLFAVLFLISAITLIIRSKTFKDLIK